MPHTDTLPDEVLDTIARQVGEHVYEVTDELPGSATAELTETLSVWRLEVDRIRGSTGDDADLSQFATPTGRWHHQVRIDGRATVFARSAPLDDEPASWRLRELFASPIAEELDQAIDWVDAHVVDDCLVHLLVVPEYQLHALWLYFEDRAQSQVLVFDAPEEYGIAAPQLYESDQFLEFLRLVVPVMAVLEEDADRPSSTVTPEPSDEDHPGTGTTGPARGTRPGHSRGRFSSAPRRASSA
jgi:hypothetical protein